MKILVAHNKIPENTYHNIGEFNFGDMLQDPLGDIVLLMGIYKGYYRVLNSKAGLVYIEQNSQYKLAPTGTRLILEQE